MTENNNCLYQMALIVLENVRKAAGDPVELAATTTAATELLSGLGTIPSGPGHEETIRYVIGAPEIRGLFEATEHEEKLPGRLTECHPVSGYMFYLDKAFPANTCMVIEDNGGEALVVLKHVRFKSHA